MGSIKSGTSSTSSSASSAAATHKPREGWMQYQTLVETSAFILSSPVCILPCNCRRASEDGAVGFPGYAAGARGITRTRNLRGDELEEQETKRMTE